MEWWLGDKLGFVIIFYIGLVFYKYIFFSFLDLWIVFVGFYDVRINVEFRFD